MRLSRTALVLVGLSAYVLAACDILKEPDPHPYGVGNGKVVVLSDLAAAGSIDVTLGGEPIGTITRFSYGCASEVTTDNGLATAVRPAGTYQVRVSTASGVPLDGGSITILADSVRSLVLRGLPSQYANHLPNEIGGLPAVPTSQSGTPGGVERNVYHLTVRSPDRLRLMVSKPTVVQGDRIDIILNGAPLVTGALLGTQDLVYDLDLVPGANYVAVRLSQDADGDGTTASAGLTPIYAQGGIPVPVGLSQLRSDRWEGKNLRREC